MNHIQIYDPALCCSSGVCGADVDQALVSAAADIDWARQQGARIERFHPDGEGRYGAHPALFRPPYGELDDTTREVVASLGQQLVLWSAVSGDPSESSTAPRMLAALRPVLRDGAIAIFHANGRGHHTHELLEALVPELRARGLELETVSQLLAGCSGAGAS